MILFHEMKNKESAGVFAAALTMACETGRLKKEGGYDHDISQLDFCRDKKDKES